MVFCDTSTLAKYYVPEEGSEAVRDRLDAEDRVVLSELARAELMAVFHRRLRERKWDHLRFLASVRQFNKDDTGGFWEWVPMDGTILRQAAQIFVTLPEKVFLRTADCLHLVTAQRHGFSEIYTHDLHQIKAAEALGLEAIVLD